MSLKKPFSPVPRSRHSLTLNISEYRNNFNGILIALHMLYSIGSFRLILIDLSDLAKYSMTWNVARSLCVCWASCISLILALEHANGKSSFLSRVMVTRDIDIDSLPVAILCPSVCLSSAFRYLIFSPLGRPLIGTCMRSITWCYFSDLEWTLTLFSKSHRSVTLNISTLLQIYTVTVVTTSCKTVARLQRNKYDDEHYIGTVSQWHFERVTPFFTMSQKHVTTFSMINWTSTVRIQRFLAHLLLFSATTLPWETVET